jgi:hypothetical protein
VAGLLASWRHEILQTKDGRASPTEQIRLAAAGELLDQAPLTMLRRPGLCATDLRALHSGHELLVIDDLFHLVRSQDGDLETSERVEVRAILGELKVLAGRCHAAVMVGWDPRTPETWSREPERQLKYLVRYLRSGMANVDTVLQLRRNYDSNDVWVDVVGYSGTRRGGFLLQWMNQFQRLDNC